MKGNLNHNNILITILPLLLLSGVPVVILPKMLNFIAEDYYFYILSLLFLTGAAFTFIKTNTISIKITIIDFFALFFFVYTIINSIIFRENFHTIKFTSFIFLGILFVITRRIFHEKSDLKGFINILMIVGYFEVMCGLLQNFEVIPNLQSNMPFGGSFANPGPFSIFLACIVILVLHSCLHYKNTKILAIAKYVFIALAVYLIIIGKIRSSWITLFVGAGIVLAYKYELLTKIKALKPLVKSGIAILLISFIIASVYFMFNLKKDSALGRVFIWKNTIEVIKNNPIIGTGFGNFIYSYNQQQAETVVSGNLTEQEYLQADDVKMAYNDFLQMTVDLGLVGLFLFLLIIVNTVRLLIKFKNENKKELIVLIAVISAILTGGLTSYPLTIIKIDILFLICIAISGSFSEPLFYKEYTISNKYSQISKYLIPVIVSVGLFFLIQQHIYIHKWVEIKNISIKNNKKYNSQRFEELFSHLSYNENIKYNYLSICISNKEIEKVYFVSKDLDKYFFDYQYMMLMGDHFMSLRNFIEARKYYNMASNIIPSRLIPRYYIILTNMELGEYRKVFSDAEKLLKLPVRIYNPSVEKIQKDCREILENNSKRRILN